MTQASPGVAAPGPASIENYRVTNDILKSGHPYVSADVMAGGKYIDETIGRCGVDRRAQNEPTIAIDPRNVNVRTAGANDYCAAPTNGDAWAGFYRSSDGGKTWIGSLLPGYLHDTSPQAAASPVHQMALGGATAAGDPVQAWDAKGNLFFMGNNFNRGIPDGNSGSVRDLTGDIWVATYGPSNPSVPSTDGSSYIRTVLVGTNTFGAGRQTDKTAIQVDQATGNVYVAWSTFHGGGCNEIVFARSTDSGASFTAPTKISATCSNQGANIAIGPAGEVYVSWFAATGGTNGIGGNVTQGAAFAVSADGGQTFSKGNIAVPFKPFASNAFSGNGARQCGDGLYACPTGQTFPRFGLAQPSIATDGGVIYLVFAVALPTGQGQIQFVKSNNGGNSWSTAMAVDNQAAGHQFFAWIAASGGRLSVVYYDSRADANYAVSRAPCNDANGLGSACLGVWYSTSTTGGVTWTNQPLTNTLFNPNLEQFGGRRVAFIGDYIMVSAVGDSIEAVWTDNRDAVIAPANNPDGNDVAGDPAAGGACTSVLTKCFDGTGGLDQNIYAAIVSFL
jgi:hypothetical protein